MSAVSKREEIIDYIKKVDEAKLEVYYNRFKEDQQVVGYRADGSAMTLLDLEKRLEKSEEQVSNGQFTSVKDLIKKHS